MLSAFQLENNRLTRLEVEESQPLVNAVWIDLVEPDDDERLRVQSELGQSLATRPELEDIEASARFFEDDDGLHIHSFFFFEDAEDHAGNSTVAFTIRDGRLFTLRERELPAFRLYRMRARSQSMVDGNAYELLLDLFETKIEQLADEIENIYSDLEQAREILRDIESLLPHNESLFQKVNFLMQAAMGFINIEQNRIIKIFSVVSVVFLPPTLVASSYGMNFEFMPELKWSFGYPGAIIFMILAGLAPYLYFKRKNWL
ncbi:TPA: magnesium transporter CorA [Escherichia coli]|nr:magnesium transporter CorA [Escherichia coli]